jgi:hypothetical protein
MKASIAAVCICVLASAISFAGVTNTTSGGPVYPTLTQAVALASSGDSLLVSTGTYWGNLLISAKDLTIEGGYLPPAFTGRTWDVEQTIITTNIVAPTVYVERGARLLLQNVRVTGGGILVLWGGGIFISDNSAVTAQNCLIDHNIGVVGGGVCAWSNALLVASTCRIEDNTAVLEGGGVYGFLASRVVVEGIGQCARNFAPRGGGLAMCGGTLRLGGGCTVNANTAIGRGGGLYLFNGAEAELEPGTYFGWTSPNVAVGGDGGHIYAESATLDVRGSATQLTALHLCGATNSGAGMFLSNSTCRITDRVHLTGPGEARELGGGICAFDSMLVLSNGVLIRGFRARDGGGLYVARGGAIVDHCSIVSNTAIEAGGGIALQEEIACRLAESTLAGNMAVLGGGLSADGASGRCTIVRADIVSNAAMIGGGGVYWSDSSGLTVTNGSLLCWNVAGSSGGGVYCKGMGTLTGCMISSNRAGYSGGGMLCVSDARVDACVLNGNVASNFGGGVSCTTGNSFKASTFTSNRARRGGGAYFFLGGALDACTMRGNEADREGGGVFCYGGGALTNCLIVGQNAADCGGAVFCHEGGTLVNCTVSDNSALTHGGGVLTTNGGTVINSIVYLNSAAMVGANWIDYGAGALYSYSCTTPTNNLPGGNHCTAAAPGFTSPGSDYHLAPGSPCIDTGTNEPWMGSATDLEGNPRIWDGVVDMGCYEWVPEPAAAMAAVFALLWAARRSNQ